LVERKTKAAGDRSPLHHINRFPGFRFRSCMGSTSVCYWITTKPPPAILRNNLLLSSSLPSNLTALEHNTVCIDILCAKYLVQENIGAGICEISFPCLEMFGKLNEVHPMSFIIISFHLRNEWRIVCHEKEEGKSRRTAPVHSNSKVWL